ncbi:60S ribosomal protein L2, mitochondrial-like [Arachis stenosperma]|uniref:60S ribosomal protein L2, mitochondrial-like n=1 Tax=Arachis stenosperma TaxID=217475 RepID=UPI0025AC98D7|nr:60S ribosomal protein L2, mitochondrial-like [Arachis stenosperma]
MPGKFLAQPSCKSLQIYNSAEGNNYIHSVFTFNLILPPQHTGSIARNMFLSAFSPKKKASSTSTCGSKSLFIGLPRIVVETLRALFFAPQVRGEEMLQVQNGMKNNVFWMYRNKRKAAISQHSIMR